MAERRSGARGKRRTGRWMAGGGLAMALFAACAPSPAPAPPAGASAAPAPPSAAAMDALFVRSCYPCHSAERRDPWYAKIAPSSWSTSGARSVLDFSTWSTYDAERRAGAVVMIADAVQRGTMPPADYTFFNHAARLDAGDRNAVERWASVAAH